MDEKNRPVTTLRDGLAAALHEMRVPECQPTISSTGTGTGTTTLWMCSAKHHATLADALLAAEPLARLVRVEAAARALLDVELSVNDPDEAPGNPLNKAVMSLRAALGEDGA